MVNESYGKILVVSPSRKTRGGITAVVRAYESSAFWKRWNCHWIETHIDRGNAWKLWYFFTAYLNYLPRLLTCDLVHIHVSEPIGAIRKSFFAIPAFALKKPVLLHFHSFSPETTIESRWKPLYRFLFCRATKVLVLSPMWMKAVQNAFGPLEIEVVPNPCTVLPSDASKSESGRRPYVLFAGTLIARKGYADLIRAFAQLADSCSEWDLVLAGNGEMDAANSLAEELGIGDRVRLPGWVSGTEKSALFRDAGIFCLPSYAEGFPMAILDAFSYGLPVVTTPVGGIPDILENGISASIVPCGDIVALVEALRALAKSRSLRESYAESSLRLAHEQFSLDSICAHLERLYLESVST